MHDAAAELKAVWYIVAAIVSLVAWLVRLEAVAKGAKEAAAAGKVSNGRQWEKLDDLDKRLSLIERTATIHASMLSPDKMQQNHVDNTRFQTETVKDIESLREKLNEIIKTLHAGRSG